MIPETFVSAFLLVCLICFFSFSFHNILRGKKLRKGHKRYAEVEKPSGLLVGMATSGTLVYFLEVVTYIFLLANGFLNSLQVSPFFFHFLYVLEMETLGLVLTAAGYVLFIWSVIARGRYAVSWDMPKNHMLITSGPYRYIRHPSYLGYFLMFFGIFPLWPSWLTLIPLVAVPGYYSLAFVEENLLIQRFGKEYLEYRRKTGQFFPKI